MATIHEGPNRDLSQKTLPSDRANGESPSSELVINTDVIEFPDSDDCMMSPDGDGLTAPNETFAASLGMDSHLPLKIPQFQRRQLTTAVVQIRSQI